MILEFSPKKTNLLTFTWWLIFGIHKIDKLAYGQPPILITITFLNKSFNAQFPIQQKKSIIMIYNFILCFALYGISFKSLNTWNRLSILTITTLCLKFIFMAFKHLFVFYKVLLKTLIFIVLLSILAFQMINFDNCHLHAVKFSQCWW